MWDNLDTELETKEEMSLSTFLLSMTSRLLTSTFWRKKTLIKNGQEEVQSRNSQQNYYFLTNREANARFIQVLNNVNVGCDHRMVRCKVQVNFKPEINKMFHTEPQPLRVQKYLVNKFQIVHSYRTMTT